MTGLIYLTERNISTRAVKRMTKTHFSHNYTRVGRCLPNCIGRCLQWNIVMDDGIGGAGLGVCPKHVSVCRNLRKTNNAFYGATKAAVLNYNPRVPQLCIFCMSLFVNTPTRLKWMQSWTDLIPPQVITWSLQSVHCRGRPICVFQGRYRYRLLQIK